MSKFVGPAGTHARLSTMPDLQALGAQCLRMLGMSDWRVTFVWLPGDKMPIPNALAVCVPTPTRHMADVSVLEPWPGSEDLVETLLHELTHALLSPLTSLIEHNPAAVMLEEGIVEKLGCAIRNGGAVAARAIGRAIKKDAPRLMARLSALSGHPRVKGRAMKLTKEQVQAALEALGDDQESPAAMILKDMLAEMIAGGSGEPDGDEPKSGEPPKPKDPTPGAVPVGDGDGAYRVKARKAIDSELARARKSADSATGIAIRARLKELRGDDVKLDTAYEAELAKMTDLDAFEIRVADFMRGRTASGAGNERNTEAADKGIRPRVNKDGPGNEPKLLSDEELKDLPKQIVAEYKATHKKDPALAQAGINAARARLANTGNPWAKKESK